MRWRILIILAVLIAVAAVIWFYFPRKTTSVQYHLAGIRYSDTLSLAVWENYFTSRMWIWLAHGAPNREQHEKALIDMGYFQWKTFVLSNRTTSDKNGVKLFDLEQKEKFRDGCWTQAMDASNTVIHILASTNDMVIWERIISEYDKPTRK